MRTSRGFTLIELLVVVAIVSLLSSVVMASLTSARGRAKDAAIKESANQLQTLMALNYSEYGGYDELQPNGFYLIPLNPSSCDSVPFSGNYASKAKEICNYMFNNSRNTSSFKLVILVSSPVSGVNNNTAFSWSVLLNNNKWYCVGSGGKGEYSVINGGLGCYNNP